MIPLDTAIEELEANIRDTEECASLCKRLLANMERVDQRNRGSGSDHMRQRFVVISSLAPERWEVLQDRYHKAMEEALPKMMQVVVGLAGALDGVMGPTMEEAEAE